MGGERRVAVTGMGAVTALGCSWPQVQARLRASRNAVRYMPEWERYTDLATKLAAPVDTFQPPAHWTRKQMRGMGRVSQLAVAAAEIALRDADLSGGPLLASGAAGVACGSSIGSIPDTKDFTIMLIEGRSPRLNANSYVRMMPHTAAANIGIFFGLKGRIIPTSSACTSGSQAIGFAYETIKQGKQTVVIAGGSEELCPSQAMSFDMLYATSRRNTEPHTTPRPYDRDRDGLVIGEGAAILVLENFEHARSRGARIYAEIVGFATNSDGSHVTRPEEATMRAVQELALADAGLPATAIGYVNGHGTATEHGDIAESRATSAALGSRVAISSQKSFFGHTLGACGAIEAWLSIEMMNAGWFAPTLNLEHIDSRCGELDYVAGEGRPLEVEHVMSNNFAFGGVNTSLVIKRAS
ncbi:MAG TPA: beta-ketoacyl-ACP synthase [Steroidobacteraceae bacterium]|nr:beta-ketoacyl-ACP synthase [Steroidobacteraceae bacterium]